VVSLLVSVLVGLAFRKPLLRIYFSPIRWVPALSFSSSCKYLSFLRTFSVGCRKRKEESFITRQLPNAKIEKHIHFLS
jgi:hypothetical protein